MKLFSTINVRLLKAWETLWRSRSYGQIVKTRKERCERQKRHLRPSSDIAVCSLNLTSANVASLVLRPSYNWLKPKHDLAGILDTRSLCLLLTISTQTAKFIFSVILYHVKPCTGPSSAFSPLQNQFILKRACKRWEWLTSQCTSLLKLTAQEFFSFQISGLEPKDDDSALFSLGHSSHFITN